MTEESVGIPGQEPLTVDPREKIARVIDPGAWLGADRMKQSGFDPGSICEPSLRKADAITQLFQEETVR